MWMRWWMTLYKLKNHHHSNHNPLRHTHAHKVERERSQTGENKSMCTAACHSYGLHELQTLTDCRLPKWLSWSLAKTPIISIPPQSHPSLPLPNSWHFSPLLTCKRTKPSTDGPQQLRQHPSPNFSLSPNTFTCSQIEELHHPMSSVQFPKSGHQLNPQKASSSLEETATQFCSHLNPCCLHRPNFEVSSQRTANFWKPLFPLISLGPAPMITSQFQNYLPKWVQHELVGPKSSWRTLTRMKKKWKWWAQLPWAVKWRIFIHVADGNLNRLITWRMKYSWFV